MKPYNEQIREARKKIGLTQAKLAEKTGISLSQLKRYEKAQQFPNYKPLLKLCEVLNIDIVISMKVEK